MTVGELIKKLGEFPPDMPIKFSFSNHFEYHNGLFGHVAEDDGFLEIQGADESENLIK